MKVTYNWLKEFVSVTIKPEALASRLTMAGLEVVSLKRHDDDWVFEIEITSNRPDWLSVAGIAREVAALTGARLLKRPSAAAKLTSGKDAPRLLMQIEDRADCPLYTAKIIRNVKVGPSPAWLRRRLELVGCRSVNTIADTTNYLLYELGEPLHAFDLETLAPGAIGVRRSRQGEQIITIDGQPRQLTPEMLVIVDSRQPVAVAGVMGGRDSQVTEKTRHVLLEAAIFNPALIRRARQLLGLPSEAAYRFERGIDPQIVEVASRRAVTMMQELAGGELVLANTSALRPSKKKIVMLSCDRLTDILGSAVPCARVSRILGRLGFKVNRKAGQRLAVTVPSFRQDVSLTDDLVEEVARIQGYGRIPTTLLPVKPQAAALTYLPAIQSLKQVLCGLGLSEVITYSLISRSLLQLFGMGQGDELLEVRNPVSSEQEILRPSLIPSLCLCAAYNARQKQLPFAGFEIAKTYHKVQGQVQEEYMVGLVLCGSWLRWYGQQYQQVQDEVGFLHLKGIIDTLLERRGISRSRRRFIPQQETGGFALEVEGKSIGHVRSANQTVMGALDAKHQQAFVAEIVLSSLCAAQVRGPSFTPFPRLPGITRDMSIVVSDEVSLEQLQEELVAQSQGLLGIRDIAIIDRYCPATLAAGHKNITLSCRYCSGTHTLSEEEVAPVHARLLQCLKEKFAAQLR